MAVEMDMKQLKLRNFGLDNISTIVKFTSGKPHFQSEEYIFNAFGSLFNMDYVNETVTKPGYDRSDSYAELTYKTDNSPDKTIKRVFGRNGKFLMDKKVVSPAMYYEKMYHYIIGMEEPFHSSPTRSMSHIMNQFFCQQWNQRLDLQSSIVEIEGMSEYRNGCLPLPVRAKYKQDITHDIGVRKKIKELNWNLCVKDHENNENYPNKVAPFTLQNSMKPLTFCNALINVFIASLLHDISAEHVEMFRRLIQTCHTHLDAYPKQNQPLAELFFFLSHEKMNINLTKGSQLRRYALSSSTFYGANDAIYFKYKQAFVAVDAWENEKANIHRKREIEKNFNAELERKLLVKEEARKNINDAIGETENVIMDLANKILFPAGEYVYNKRNFIVKMLLTFFRTKILLFVNEFCEVLGEILNHPTLENADIKNCVAGLVHCIVNDYGVDQPEFLFDHVESLQEKLHFIVQTYLAPLSKILFFPTTEGVLDLQERIMAAVTVDSFATTFIFSAHNTIERQKAPVQPSPRILSKIRKNFGYKDSFANLLSNLQITKRQFPVRHLNVLQMATNKNYFANNEMVLANGTNNLFVLLRAIKRIYTDIKAELRAINVDNLLDHIAHLIDGCDKYYEAESNLRSELLTLQRLNLELVDVECAIVNLQRLQIKSRSRLTIYDRQLNCSEDIDEDMDSKFIEMLSAHKTNVFDVDNVDRGYRVVAKISQNVYQMHGDTELLCEYFGDFQLEWQEMAADLKIEPNIPVQEKLSIITKLDFPLSGYYFTKHFSLNGIPKKHRKVTALSRQEILNQIDQRIYTLHFPMASPKRLTKYEKMLKKHEEIPAMVDRWFTMLTNLLINFDQLQTEKLLNLGDNMCRVLKAVKQIDDCGVRLDVGRVDYDLCNWTKLFTKKRCIQSVHYHATVGDQPDVKQDDFIVILLYVCYVLRFTMQPLILNNIVKGRQHLIPEIVELFSKMKLNRFVLVFDQNRQVAPQQDQNGQNAPDQDQNRQNAPDQDQNGQNAPDQDQNRQNAPDQDQNRQNAPDQDQNGQNAPDQDQNRQNAPDQDQNRQNAPDQDQNGQNAPDQDQNGQNAPDQDQNEEVHHNQYGREETDRNDGEASARHPNIPSTSEQGHPNDLRPHQAPTLTASTPLRVNIFQNLDDFQNRSDFENVSDVFTGSASEHSSGN